MTGAAGFEPLKTKNKMTAALELNSAQSTLSVCCAKDWSANLICQNAGLTSTRNTAQEWVMITANAANPRKLSMRRSNEAVLACPLLRIVDFLVGVRDVV